MPAHGTYDVQAAGVDANGVGNKDVATSGKQSSRDSSYRSCIHAMVIFVIFCIVLMLAAWPWRSQSNPKQRPVFNSSYQSQANVGHTTRSTPTQPSTSTHPSTSTRPSTFAHSVEPFETTPPPDITTATYQHHETTPPPDITTATYQHHETTPPPDITTTAYQHHERNPHTSVKPDYPGENDENNTQSHTTISHVFTEVNSEADRIEGIATTDSVPVSRSTENVDDWPVQSTTILQETTAPYRGSSTHGIGETTLQDTSSRPTPNRVEDDVTDIADMSRTPAQPAEATTIATTQHSNGDLIDNIPLTNSSEETTTMVTTVVHDYGSEAQSTTHFGAEHTLATEENKETTTNRDVEKSTEGNDEQQTEEALPNPQQLVHSEDTETESPQAVTSAPDAVCSSSQCKVLASRMLSLMNHSANACDDFYSYSCGGLQTNKALNEDNPEDAANSRIKAEIQKIDNEGCQAEQKFKQYYDSCLAYEQKPNETEKQERINAVREAVARIGTFHTQKTWTPESDNFTDLISQLMLHHSTPLFDITLDVDGSNPDKMAFKLATSDFHSVFRKGVPRRDCVFPTEHVTDLKRYYDEYSNCTSLPGKEYMNKVEHVIEDLGVFESLNKSRFKQTQQDIVTFIEWDVLQIDNGQQEQKKPAADARRIDLLSKTFVEMTVVQLQEEFNDLIEWKVLLGNLIELPADAIPDNTKIQVYFKSYMEEMFSNLKNSERRKLQNALLAMYAHDLYVDLIDIHDECAREEYCQHVATSLMPEVASSLYLASFRPGELDAMRRDADDIFELLRNTTEQQLTQGATWVDEMTKSDAVMKLKNMKLAVDGGASLFEDDAFLDLSMKRIELSDEGYLPQSLALVTRYRRQLYSLYNAHPKSVDVIWQQFLHPYSTSGVSIYSLNTIVIPYGLMTWPLYEESLPRYLQMAGLGFVIAHEMSHHFDSSGILFRPGGMKGDSIISPDVMHVYESYKNCHSEKDGFGFTKSYAVDGRQVNVVINGDLSLNERLADDTATSLAWKTYKSWSPIFEHRLPWLGKDVRQLYFIALAQTFCTKSSILDHVVELFEDEHLPASQRVHGFIRNSNEFADAFQCDVNTNMNPPSVFKCDVFPLLHIVDDNIGNPAPS